MSYAWWNDKHNRHHANPNHIGKDPDVAAGVLVFAALHQALFGLHLGMAFAPNHKRMEMPDPYGEKRGHLRRQALTSRPTRRPASSTRTARHCGTCTKWGSRCVPTSDARRHASRPPWRRMTIRVVIVTRCSPTP